MANLAGDLTKELFGKSEAAKTFRPSWVDMGDYVLYSMVAMGECGFKPCVCPTYY